MIEAISLSPSKITRFTLLITAMMMTSCAVQNTKPTVIASTETTAATKAPESSQKVTNPSERQLLTYPSEGQLLSNNVADCSVDYQQKIAPLLQKYQQPDLNYAQLQIDTDPQQLTKLGKESVGCQKGVLTNVKSMLAVKQKALQSQLDESGLSAKQRRELTQNLLNTEQQLFEVNIHLGLMTPDSDELAYWHQAHNIWIKWHNTPVAIEDLDTLIDAAMTTKAMKDASSSLTHYLHTYHGKAIAANDRPKMDKRDLILNQTFIYLAQLDERNRLAKQQLSLRAKSAPWLSQMAVEFRETYNDKTMTADKVEAAILKFIDQDDSQYMTQFIKLTNLRYQDFSEVQMLESAKTFLVEDAEHLPMSQLLAAMDYAKLGDKVSSERWLHQAFEHEDMSFKICQMMSADLARQSQLFAETNGKWFQNQIKKQCQ